MKIFLLISALFVVGCSGVEEPEWLFDVQMCEAEGGFATVQDMGYYTEVTCDLPDSEQCYAICKPGADCPFIDCE